MLALAALLALAFADSWRWYSLVAVGSASPPFRVQLNNVYGTISLQLWVPGRGTMAEPIEKRAAALTPRGYRMVARVRPYWQWREVNEWWARLGFYWDRGPWPGVADVVLYTLALPHWLLAGLVLLAWRRLRPPKPGCCHKCGYDLRATPDRCPECGAVPASPVAT
ncbi:MAG TPA: hypothetical protein VK324_15035 [Tepidisphaeraceae bacterium]|nr:hypothetical protein [Tepidisphaeraceae bacterium]